jgi:hypothetical protein
MFLCRRDRLGEWLAAAAAMSVFGKLKVSQTAV